MFIIEPIHANNTIVARVVGPKALSCLSKNSFYIAHAYQNMVTSQTTMFRVQFVTGILLVFVDENKIKQYFLLIAALRTWALVSRHPVHISANASS